MGRGGGCKNQMIHAIANTQVQGVSKKEYKLQHNGSNDNLTFSRLRAENLRATANELGGYLKAQGITKCQAVTAQHLQGWLDSKQGSWSQATANEKLSSVRVIWEKLQTTYGSMSADTSSLTLSGTGYHGAVRTVAMNREDYNKIQTSFAQRGSTSMGSRAMEITARCGLRVDEVAHLKGEEIDLDKNVLHLHHTKNGKYRDVPIREPDRAFFRELKEKCPVGRVCKGVSGDSLNTAIRREMKLCNLASKYKKTTQHAIRKMYARERMQQERAKGLSERDAWRQVQKELGHGDRFRQELYNTYIGG